VNDKNTENQYQVLEKYCQDITKQAKEGKLDPVIGRHEEIRRVIQILSRRIKNNPVLIGEPGVGKTAIVDGIAQRIVNNDVPESLKNNRILSLDLGLLIAGAKYQGEFEERVKLPAASCGASYSKTKFICPDFNTLFYKDYEASLGELDPLSLNTRI
jgi:ATP-dependent Clp protease ATP-binding subunit ClpB